MGYFTFAVDTHRSFLPRQPVPQQIFCGHGGRFSSEPRLTGVLKKGLAPCSTGAWTALAQGRSQSASTRSCRALSSGLDRLGKTLRSGLSRVPLLATARPEFTLPWPRAFQPDHRPARTAYQAPGARHDRCVQRRGAARRNPRRTRRPRRRRTALRPGADQIRRGMAAVAEPGLGCTPLKQQLLVLPIRR